ncbi:hypothetical protein [Paraburkholderia tagetis]|uniref:TniQ protein n=2 Tax=Paraburkholderia TaxID=1822464 RepID=A0A9X1RWV2_9BURK|nr:hypothetical protein [Paraburkholderia tagetis]
MESAWSRFAKFQLLNRLNWTQLGEALAILPAINTGEGIDLRAADAFRLPDLADTLHIGLHDLENSFCTANRIDALLDAASPSLRFCLTCASVGFHATLFQFTAFRHCPIHGCVLCEACTGCGQPLAYRLHAGLVRHPYACPVCGRSLLAAASLRRLRTKTGIDATGLDRLRAWHEYFFRYVQLLGPGRRRMRDAAGQYLPGDEIQASSDIPRRLMFIGELERHLRRPPELPRVDPAPRASVHSGNGPRPSVCPPARFAWADDWPHLDHTCIMLCAVYRKIRKNRVRRLARSVRPVQPEAVSVRHSPEFGLLLCDGNTAAQSIALLGWRLSWERRFSMQTLTRCQGNYPPFGLLEWLAFMPAHLPPTVGPQDWLHRHFVHALDQTWNAWRTIASGMQESGCYVVSPLLFPTRMLWMDYADDGGALGIVRSRTHVVPLREAADRT